MSLTTIEPKLIYLLILGLAFVVGIVLFQYKEIRNSNAKNDCTLTIAEKELLPENTSLFETQSNENFYEKLQKGKVLLVFIMTDCAACKSESQIISASLNSIASKAKIYGVVREDKEKVKKFIDTNNINFPILIDNDGALFNKLKIKCTPTNLIIEDGLVKKVLIGSPKDEKCYCKTWIYQINLFRFKFKGIRYETAKNFNYEFFILPNFINSFTVSFF